MPAHTVLGTGALILGGVLLGGLLRMETAVSEDVNEFSVSAEAADLAVEVGLEPASLILVGANAVQVQAMLERIDQASELRSSIRVTRAALDGHLQQIAEAQSVLLIAPRDQAAQAQLQQAEGELLSTEQVLDQLRADLRAVATAEILSEPQIAELGDFQERLQFGCSTALHEYDATIEVLAEIAGIERQEHRCLRLGESLKQEDASTLENARSHPDVARADGDLSANLDTIAALYDSQ